MQKIWHIFADLMSNDFQDMIKVRTISVGFTILALVVFKPFELGVWQWEAYVHLIAIGVIGIGVCLITECILKYVVKMPKSDAQGVDYIIHRNLWFQFINTPLIALMICLYRHFFLSNRFESNQLSWSNFLETLLIIAFCSFAIGLYWRFKYRSKYLRIELEEMQLLNKQLQKPQELSVTPQSSRHILIGTTNEKLSLQISDILYIESVGNYVKVYQIHDGKVQTNMLRSTSKQIEKDLSPYPTIVRCHRAFLVNLQQVEQIISRSGNVQLLIKHCHEFIPVSRSNMTQVKSAIKSI